MMGKPNPAVKEAFFVLGVLTVAMAVGITVIAVWLAGKGGGEAASPPAAATTEQPAPPPPATTATAPPPPATTAAVSVGDAAAGKAVFASQGCGACHTFAAAGASAKVGPSLDSLAAAAQQAGEPLDAFVRDSIVDPNKFIAPGYQKGIMPPNFGQALSAKQLADLVAFVVTNQK